MSDFDGTVERPFFVWVSGPKGLNPQKWSELNFGLNNWKKQIVVAWHPLSADQFLLPIDDLTKSFPPEKCYYKSNTG